MKITRYALLGVIPLLFSGCIFTKYEVIEKPIYITRPMPILKVYDVNATFTFKGLRKNGVYIEVPEKQFRDYIDLKKDLEKQLNKANKQVQLYNINASKTIKENKGK